MPIRFECFCGKKVKAPDELAGKQAKCPKCGCILEVPQITTASESVLEIDADSSEVASQPTRSTTGQRDDAQSSPSQLNPGASVPPPATPDMKAEQPQASETWSPKKESSKFCPTCGNQIHLHAEICPKCGVRQPQSRSQELAHDDLDFSATKAYLIATPKNPGLAAVLSFFVPGLGQIYNGEIFKRFLFILLPGGATIASCLVWSLSLRLAAFPVVLVVGSAVYLIAWILGIIDAYATADRHNRRQRPRRW